MSDDHWRTDTAERPAVRAPATPPSPLSVLPPDRPPVDVARPVRRAERPPAPAWIAWLVVGAVLVATAFVGAYLVVRNPGTSTATDTRPADAAEQEPSDQPSAEPPENEPAEEGPVEEPPEPVGDPVDVTSTTTATVPGEAPSNNDVTGELVTFVGDNLLDADATTCWRIAGDATGSTITFTFPAPVTLTEVGLVNGYAKTSVDDAGQAFDWYHGNRRVLSAEWVVAGQTFAQDFGDTTELQALAIEPVETTTVELRLTGVSPPGAGPTGRDYTAISDVRLTGSQ